MEYRKYAQIWNRYIPVIRILLKKSLQGEQVLNLDKGDFEKAGARKAGFKFKIEFLNGRVNNRISESEMASELAVVMQENEGVRTILSGNEFTIELNSKYQLKISCRNAPLKPESVKEVENKTEQPEAVTNDESSQIAEEAQSETGETIPVNEKEESSPGQETS